jgi:small-conductance mechanosensitive channel
MVVVEDKTEEIEEPKTNGTLQNILWYLTFIVGLALVILYWGVFINLNEVLNSLQSWVPKVAVTLLTIFVVNLFLKLSRPVLRRTYRGRGGKLEDWKVVSNIYTYIIWVLTGIIIFTGIFGSISSLGISLGIIGAGLAFALQQPILSFSGWFLIVLKKPFSIGDRVILSKEGVMGDVEDITVFFFVLKEVTDEESQTGRTVIVPNSAVFQGSILNYSYDTPHVWTSIPVSVTYESDLEIAENTIFQAAIKVAGDEMKRGARLHRRLAPDSVHTDLVKDRPVIRVEFGESSINLNLRILCLPKQIRPFKTAIYKEIFNLFKLKENKDQVEIAYPHMEIVAHVSFKHFKDM